MSFKEKYLKYKNKYLELKQSGGIACPFISYGNDVLDYDRNAFFNIVLWQNYLLSQGGVSRINLYGENIDFVDPQYGDKHYELDYDTQAEENQDFLLVMLQYLLGTNVCPIGTSACTDIVENTWIELLLNNYSKIYIVDLANIAHILRKSWNIKNGHDELDKGYKWDFVVYYRDKILNFLFHTLFLSSNENSLKENMIIIVNKTDKINEDIDMSLESILNHEYIDIPNDGSVVRYNPAGGKYITIVDKSRISTSEILRRLRNVINRYLIIYDVHYTSSQLNIPATDNNNIKLSGSADDYIYWVIIIGISNIFYRLKQEKSWNSIEYDKHMNKIVILSNDTQKMGFFNGCYERGNVINQVNVHRSREYIPQRINNPPSKTIFSDLLAFDPNIPGTNIAPHKLAQLLLYKQFRDASADQQLMIIKGILITVNTYYRSQIMDQPDHAWPIASRYVEVTSRYLNILLDLFKIITSNIITDVNPIINDITGLGQVVPVIPVPVIPGLQRTTQMSTGFLDYCKNLLYANSLVSRTLTRRVEFISLPIGILQNYLNPKAFFIALIYKIQNDNIFCRYGNRINLEKTNTNITKKNGTALSPFDIEQIIKLNFTYPRYDNLYTADFRNDGFLAPYNVFP